MSSCGGGRWPRILKRPCSGIGLLLHWLSLPREYCDSTQQMVRGLLDPETQASLQRRPGRVTRPAPGSPYGSVGTACSVSAAEVACCSVLRLPCQQRWATWIEKDAEVESRWGRRCRTQVYALHDTTRAPCSPLHTFAWEEVMAFAAEPERSSRVLVQAVCLPVSLSDKSRQALGSGLIRLSQSGQWRIALLPYL